VSAAALDFTPNIDTTPTTIKPVNNFDILTTPVKHLFTDTQYNSVSAEAVYSEQGRCQVELIKL
jgi:hypothetical protein